MRTRHRDKKFGDLLMILLAGFLRISDVIQVATFVCCRREDVQPSLGRIHS